eukprot:snap_masked-scaffold_30-processed-gene-0.14-mRNA-1 protein AED:1.00 eAED:1.00 QI:0/-1/0/0/-1/1/1/0/379
MKIQEEIEERKNNLWKSLIKLSLLFSFLLFLAIQSITPVDNFRKSVTISSEFEEDSAFDNTLKKDTFTILISTYDRDRKLFDGIYRYLHIPNVEEIYIVWFDTKRKIPEEFDLFSDSSNFPNITNLPKVTFLHFEKHLLSNRLRPPPGGFKTHSVFSVDDDVNIDNNLIAKGFEVWKKGGANRVVGYEPRLFDLDGDGQGYNGGTSCKICLFNTFWITKGAFIDQKYYTEVWNKEYSSVMNLVKKYRTGEDMLMSYVLSASNYFNEKVELIVLQKYFGFPEFELPKYTAKVNTIRSIFRKRTRSAEQSKPAAESLGTTTSQYRPLIRVGLQKLSEEKFGFSSGPFDIFDQWHFVDANLNIIVERDICDTILKKKIICGN